MDSYKLYMILGCVIVYLKSLEIQGFKSFPDKIHLEFGQGITAIVGPNGSGKSNISDAVRWVMGEQSAKILRGSKMEDIIFAGTETRKALGFAEVSLTLNNADKILPIDFNEVTVTRRVYRSGESEYYINKSLCRLKDIHQLFMDTGLGKDGYSIIGQGRIDEILSNKSEDRRQVFEEAAGITKYKYRKQEAEKKLELTRQNLIRIKDIITELEMQIEPLQEQAEKAKKYLNLREDLKTLEINLALHNIEKLKQNLQEIEKNYNLLEIQLKNDKSELEKAEREIEKLEAVSVEKDNEVEVLRKKLHDDESLIQKYKSDIELLKNNICNNETNRSKLEIEIRSAADKIERMESEARESKETLEKLQHTQQTIKDSIVSLERKHQSIYQLIEAGNKEIDLLKSELIEKMNKISEIKGKINSVKVLDNNFTDRKGVLQKEINQKTLDIEQIDALVSKLTQDFASNEEKLRQNRETLSRMNVEKSNQNKRLEMLRNDYNQNVSLMKEKMSKVKMLQEMENEYEGYHKSVKGILLEWQNGCLKHLNIHGPISQLIHVPKQYVTAVETVLGAAMQNIVVQSEQDAKTAIQFLKSRHLGRATFLPISSVTGRELHHAEEIANFPGCLGIASKLIQYDSIYEQIIVNLLGRVVIVDDIDTGIQMARKFGYKFRIVTLEGDILNPGGSMTGGSVNKTVGFLSRANEIKTLEGEIVQLRSSAEEVISGIKQKEAELQEMNREIQEIEQMQKEFEAIGIKLEADINHYRSIYETMVVTKEELLQESNQLEEQIFNTRNEMQELSNTIISYEDEIKQIESLISNKKMSFDEEAAERERLSQTIINKKMELNSIEKDIELLNERIRIMHSDIMSCRNDQKQKENELLVLQQKNAELNGEIQEKDVKIQALEDTFQMTKDNLDKIHNERRDIEQFIKKHQSIVKEKRDSISILQEEYRRVENRKVRVELELENTINKLWDDYEQTYSSALTYKKEIENFSQVRRTISDLKDELKKLGSVNVNAIEEYKNVKERYEFLTGQQIDLEDAEKTLVKIIDDMVRLMNKQFSEQFKIINENFNMVFNELFGGGRAGLKLAEPNNILESGIEIEVQPPGKKLQNLMLLSGGERAFTAIALLFAILKVRPTPFCILDEIEAALDDGNVYRFAEYLKQFSQQTQFIIVTHRRGTMEAADLLYGVTMQERGVSKLLALNVEEIANQKVS